MKISTTNKPQKGENKFSVAVCGPVLYHHDIDISKSLIEWLEILHYSGIDKVLLYAHPNLHPNIKKVLDFYKNLGLVHVIPFSFPPPYIHDPLLKR